MIASFGIGRVIRSKHSNFADGDIVINPFMPVAEYSIVPSDPSIRKIDLSSSISLPDYLSSLGNHSFHFLLNPLCFNFKFKNSKEINLKV